MSLGVAYAKQFFIQSELSECRNLYPYVIAPSAFCDSKERVYTLWQSQTHYVIALYTFCVSKDEVWQSQPIDSRPLCKGGCRIAD